VLVATFLDVSLTVQEAHHTTYIGAFALYSHSDGGSPERASADLDGVLVVAALRTAQQTRVPTQRAQHSNIPQPLCFGASTPPTNASAVSQQVEQVAKSRRTQSTVLPAVHIPTVQHVHAHAAPIAHARRQLRRGSRRAGIHADCPRPHKVQQMFSLVA
jgi:hypothetical protein